LLVEQRSCAGVMYAGSSMSLLRDLDHDHDPRDKTPVELVPFREFREHVRHENRMHQRLVVILVLLFLLQVVSVVVIKWL